MLGQDFAVVLGQDARRAPADELVQVRFVAPERERGRAQGTSPWVGAANFLAWLF